MVHRIFTVSGTEINLGKVAEVYGRINGTAINLVWLKLMAGGVSNNTQVNTRGGASLEAGGSEVVY